MTNLSKNLKIGDLIASCQALLDNLKEFEAQQQCSGLKKSFNYPTNHDYINYRYDNTETYLCRSPTAFRPRQVFGATDTDETESQP